MTLNTEIEKIKFDFLNDLKNIKNLKDLENLKIEYLGKKGILQNLMKFLAQASKEEKPKIGQLINVLKKEVSNKIEQTFQVIELEMQQKQISEESIDIALPGKKDFWGRYHPITAMMNKMVDILISMGFSVETGPDIDSDFYNFEGLNFSKDHPARDMQDTFYISDDLLLRTHTSNVQVRVLEKFKPPIRCIAPGKCYRNETISARSHVFFNQLEIFYVDENVTFADLFATLDEFWMKVFNKKIETRYRPSYFPFVEPGLECDIKCIICEGQGCQLCKYTGWLEVAGAGMIHPNVLKYGDIDPEEYSGYAVGLGVERLAMLLYQIKDIRYFTDNDMRFLEQFSL